MDLLSSLNPTDLLSTRGDGRLEALQARVQKNNKKSEREMREAAKQFETMMIRQLLKEMRKTVPKDGLDEESHASEMYTEIADDYLAQELGAASNFGIADLIYADLKRQHEPAGTALETQKNTVDQKLNPDSHAAGEKKFIPLHRDTERFMKWQSASKMMELPQKKNEFKELSHRRWIPSDKISNP